LKLQRISAESSINTWRTQMINVRNEAQQLLLDQVATGRLDRREFLSMVRGLAGVAVLALPVKIRLLYGPATTTS
jgi:hypothetical protein